MHRRNFIKTTGFSLSSLLISDSFYAFGNPGQQQLISFPDDVSAILNNQTVKLGGTAKQKWTYQELMVSLANNSKGISVMIVSPNAKLSSVSLHWKISSKQSSKILNDHWERTYGDVSWHAPSSSEILPWYFMEFDGKTTNGFGVRTGANAFCSWTINNNELILTVDTRSGGNGVQLGDRKLKAAEIITIRGNPGESSFDVGRKFMKQMCDKARMPKQPVYGINDWYFTYGNNSAKLIMELTELMVPMSAHLSNRPFSVIDAGWFQGPPSNPHDCCWGDNMSSPNSSFGDMAKLAEDIKKAGMRPGLWTRPLCGSYKDASSLMLPSIAGRNDKNKPVLDPSIPENLERIKNYFKLYKQWGFEMVKFDFTSYDAFGKWGFEMLKDAAITPASWSMNDTSKTNAEIISNMYHAIREAAGETYIIGCNTFSHLSAGLFELNRIGDDTSGKEWDRTRKMGVNTLAFRGVQHGIFYAADADCVGLTNLVPWEKNKQWMELVAKSGTPLFISAQPEATQAKQKEAIKACFTIASKTLPVGEALDAMENAFPKKWRLNGVVETFEWD